MANTESKGQGRQQSRGRCLKESRNGTMGPSSLKVPRISIRIKEVAGITASFERQLVRHLGKFRLSAISSIKITLVY